MNMFTSHLIERLRGKVYQTLRTLRPSSHSHEQLDFMLHATEERYRHILNAAADAIISIDEKGLVREFNWAAELLFGFTHTEMIGQPLTPMIPASLRQRHLEGLHHFLDTGIGMSADQIEGVFKEFQQVHESVPGHRYGGTGLGLAISQRFCRMLGGDVQVESTVGQGSTFTARLPCAFNASKDRDTKPSLDAPFSDVSPNG